jgi:putative peptide zinc metalloprotease protein
MDTDALEPRKSLRVRVRTDLVIQAQRYEGRTCYVVKDPASLRYYRFQDREYFLMRCMDGQHTLEHAQKEFEKHFRPDRLRLEEVEGFAQLLLSSGLASSDSSQTAVQLFDQWQQQRRRRRLLAVTDLLYLQFPLFDPDRLLGRMLPYLRWMFTAGFFAASVGLMLAALLLVAVHFDTFRNKLPAFHEFFTITNLVYVWLTLGVVKVIHEFGHGLTCKAMGREVHEMGALFVCMAPCLYCNVSDAWTLPRKRQRIMVSFAGIYVELLLAALATFLWWYTPGHSPINQWCCRLMIVCSVSTVVFNANPLLRYDGYYALADWLEVPNLRERSGRFLKGFVAKHCLGIERPPELAMARARRCFLAAYAVVSQVYRWLLTAVVLWLMYGFLRPYGLGALGGLLAGLSAASMFGWPLYGWLSAWRRRGRLPAMRTWRVLLSLAVLGALFLAACLTPLPMSSIRQTALTEVRPEAIERVYAPAPAVLERLHVRDGQAVQAGEALAEFRSLDAENLLEEARSSRDIREVECQSLRNLAESLPDRRDRARAELAQTAAAAERLLLARQIETYDKILKRLVIRAPRAGVVMGVPSVDHVGKLWSKDEDTLFCTLGDPTRLRALVPVAPADYRLLQEDLEGTSSLAATITLPGMGGRRFKGQLTHLPAAEAKEVPLALTARGGGPLAADPNSSPGHYRPQPQQYLVVVDCLDSDPAVYPGMLAWVQIQCRPRTAAWWLWRTAALLFGSG